MRYSLSNLKMSSRACVHQTRGHAPASLANPPGARRSEAGLRETTTASCRYNSYCFWEKSKIKKTTSREEIIKRRGRTLKTARAQATK